MKVRIFKPAKTAMQSGQANTREWLLESEPTPKILDPLITPKTTVDPTATYKPPLNLDTANTAMGAGKPGLGQATGGASGTMAGVANTLLTTRNNSGTLG